MGKPARSPLGTPEAICGLAGWTRPAEDRSWPVGSPGAPDPLIAGTRVFAVEKLDTRLLAPGSGEPPAALAWPAAMRLTADFRGPRAKSRPRLLAT